MTFCNVLKNLLSVKTLSELGVSNPLLLVPAKTLSQLSIYILSNSPSLANGAGSYGGELC